MTDSRKPDSGELDNIDMLLANFARETKFPEVIKTYANYAETKAAITTEIRQAIHLTWNKSGEGYNGEYPITAKDGTNIEEAVTKEVLAELRPTEQERS